MEVIEAGSATGGRASTAIVVVESATRPTLTPDLAEGCPAYLRCPVVGRLAIRRPDVGPAARGRGPTPPSGSPRSAARFALEADGPRPRRPVLLVDDLVVTGWTLTLAARAIRAAGAGEVLPLALGAQG